MPIRMTIAALFIAAILAACGSAEESPPGTTLSPQNEVGADGQGGWWLYEGPDYQLVEGGPTPADISQSTGSLWRLEYSNSTSTIQLAADRANSLFAQLSAGSPQIGTATVDGIEAVLRQHPGSPDDGIPPSVGAEWIDGDVFVSFSGGGLTEGQMRGLLSHVRRVTHSEWEAAVESAAESDGA
ncbi:MAG: hypothetical protein KY395_08590 [Actinobacteria bacterium]|nr:hypothetical protein [Actinomycetota bacterium]